MVVIDLEMNETGFQVFGSSCNSTAPRPYDNASAAILVALLGSYKVSIGDVVRAVLILLKASCCGGLHVHAVFLTSNSRMGFVISARFEVNLLNWFTIPRKERTSCGLVGCGISMIACFSLGLAVFHSSPRSDQEI